MLKPILILCLVISRMALAACEVAPPNDQTKIYLRSHQTHHFNGEEPTDVVDELKIWDAEKVNACFLLNTIGPNNHECDVSGKAQRQTPNLKRGIAN